MQPPLTVILINNGGGGIFSFLPIADAVVPEVFTPLWATPQNVDLAGQLPSPQHHKLLLQASGNPESAEARLSSCIVCFSP